VPQNLPIFNLAERHQGVTPAIGESFTEAARVCLDRHHQSPIAFTIDDSGAATSAIVDWETADEKTRMAHANETDATEWGAYACALATTELARGLFAIRRAETQTGADYYLAAAGTRLDDLEKCFRLEVSGTLTRAHRKMWKFAFCRKSHKRVLAKAIFQLWRRSLVSRLKKLQ